MKHVFTKAVTAAAFVIGLSGMAQAATPYCASITSARDMNIIIPAYVYPGDGTIETAYWDKIVETATIAQKAGFRLAIIVNPNNGNFTTEDANYDALIKRLDKTGALILGYVHTSNATRPVADVQTNMMAYKTFYPEIDGFFIDETNIKASTFSYYVKLRKTAVQQFGSGVFLVGNAPGDGLATNRYREVFNLTIAFEDYGRKLSGLQATKPGNTGEPVANWVSGPFHRRNFRRQRPLARLQDRQDVEIQHQF